MAESLRTLAAIKIFRHAVVDILKAKAIIGIGENVFESRTEKIWPEETGAVIVYTTKTDFDDKRTSPRFYVASTMVEIDVIASKIAESVNDFLDDVSEAVVLALQPVEKRVGPFNGTVKRFVLKSFENSLSGLSELEWGTQRITFLADWSCCLTHGGPADEFVTGKNKFSVGEGEGNEQSFETKVQT